MVSQKKSLARNWKFYFIYRMFGISKPFISSIIVTTFAELTSCFSSFTQILFNFGNLVGL